jgi:hypothetical protein
MILASLVSECADPIARGILRSKLHVSLNAADGSHENQDALEILSEAHTQLLLRLRRLRSDSQGEMIGNFRGYVAVLTYHACYQHLRHKHPERWRLKNKLRYLVTHRPGFALWQDERQQWICGISDWRGRGQIVQSKLDRLREDSWFLANQTKRAEAHPDVIADLLTTIFENSGGPIGLEDLVSLVGESCGIRRAAQTDIAVEETLTSQDDLKVAQLDVAAVTEQRIHLGRLWSEISELPLKHRAALLLNLRDTKGRGVIHLLPMTRVATIRQIADTLELTTEEFAGVWNELPWDDAAIATHLGLTRQQVINLRHSARARLARRVKGF